MTIEFFNGVSIAEPADFDIASPERLVDFTDGTGRVLSKLAIGSYMYGSDYINLRTHTAYERYLLNNGYTPDELLAIRAYGESLVPYILEPNRLVVSGNNLVTNLASVTKALEQSIDAVVGVHDPVNLPHMDRRVDRRRSEGSLFDPTEYAPSAEYISTDDPMIAELADMVLEPTLKDLELITGLAYTEIAAIYKTSGSPLVEYTPGYAANLLLRNGLYLVDNDQVVAELAANTSQDPVKIAAKIPCTLAFTVVESRAIAKNKTLRPLVSHIAKSHLPSAKQDLIALARTGRGIIRAHELSMDCHEIAYMQKALTDMLDAYQDVLATLQRELNPDAVNETQNQKDQQKLRRLLTITG